MRACIRIWLLAFCVLIQIMIFNWILVVKSQYLNKSFYGIWIQYRNNYCMKIQITIFLLLALSARTEIIFASQQPIYSFTNSKNTPTSNSKSNDPNTYSPYSTFSYSSRPKTLSLLNVGTEPSPKPLIKTTMPTMQTTNIYYSIGAPAPMNLSVKPIVVQPVETQKIVVPNIEMDKQISVLCQNTKTTTQNPNTLSPSILQTEEASALFNGTNSKTATSQLNEKTNQIQPQEQITTSPKDLPIGKASPSATIPLSSNSKASATPIPSAKVVPTAAVATVNKCGANEINGVNNEGFGLNNLVNGNDNDFLGKQNRIDGNSNNCYGDSNAITGDINTVKGCANEVSGNLNRVIGSDNTVKSLGQFKTPYLATPTHLSTDHQDYLMSLLPKDFKSIISIPVI